MLDELKEITPGEFLLWLLRLRRRLRVTGTSMLPLLKPGQEVLVNPRAYRQVPPCPGDIVVARHPYHTDLQLIKRVVAITDDGRCHLEGDNPNESTDSRTFGAIPVSTILGRVTSRFG